VLDISAPLRKRSLRSSFVGTSSLAVNGGALIVNVITGGVTGFVFWIVVARAVEPDVVAEATAMVTTMLSIVTLSQTSLAVNVPVLIAAARRPRRLAAFAYGGAAAMTACGALLYVIVAPRLASGLEYLRDPRLFVVFVLGCLIWSPFALQDAVMTGLRRGRFVLLENSLWGMVRLGAAVILPAIGVQLGIGWIVAAWIVPAAVLVLFVSYLLFVRPSSPLAGPLGDHQFDKRELISFLGVEQLASVTGGLVALAVPAYALTALGATPAAPFLAAYSFIVVAEAAMGSFSSAFAVELRRNERSSRNLITMTCLLLGAFSFGTILLAQFFADDFMSLFGSEYRGPGGAVLAILVLGLPARCVWMLSSAANRIRGDGWKNFAQTVGYSATLFAGFALIPSPTVRSLAVCLVVARYVAAGISIRNLLSLWVKRGPEAAPTPAQVAVDA
jgi:hypothetical protein